MRAIIAASALLWSASSFAAQPLEAFLSRAKTQSFDAREVEATRRQREEEASVALGRLLPALSARGVYTRNQYEAAAQLPGSATKLVIQPENQLDASVQLEVPLFDAASYYRYKASQGIARAAGEQMGATEVDVSRAVARSYFQYLGAAGLFASARGSVEATEQNLKSVENKRGAGVATDLDRERARANVERARQDVADAELALALFGRNLETLSGLTPEAATPPVPDDLHEEAPLARWAALAGETPQERTSRALVAAAAESKKAATLALLPTLTGTAQERYTNATGFAGKDTIYTLQLVASWRLDYGTYKTPHALDAAREVAAVREARARRAVSDAIFEAYRRVENGIVKSRSARAQASAATKAAELAGDRYAAGVSTQLDVTQAQRDAFLADASRIQADADLSFARATLRIAAGRSPSDPRSP